MPSRHTQYADQINHSPNKEQELASIPEGTGLDSETWLELRRLLDLMTEREDAGSKTEILTGRARA